MHSLGIKSNLKNSEGAFALKNGSNHAQLEDSLAEERIQRIFLLVIKSRHLPAV